MRRYTKWYRDSHHESSALNEAIGHKSNCDFSDENALAIRGSPEQLAQAARVDGLDGRAQHLDSEWPAGQAVTQEQLGAQHCDCRSTSAALKRPFKA